MLFGYKLTSLTALLIHADDVEQADTLKKWREAPENKDLSVPGDDRSPPWTWMTYLYNDGTHLAVPSDNIMVALRFAGAMITLKGAKTFKRASQSGLLMHEEYCRLIGPNGPVPMAALKKFENAPFSEHCSRVQDLGFKLFTKRCRLPGKMSKNVRVRARFDEWSLQGTIEIRDSIITPEILSQLFNFAGRYAGLCDWRPSSPDKPGTHGTFEAEVMPIKDKKAG